jgi:predicted amidohydrolase
VPTLRIGLASAPNLASMSERLDYVDRFMGEAASREVAIVCFPECYLPGLRGMDFEVSTYDHASQSLALERLREIARLTGVAMIMGMEWQSEAGLLNTAFVVDRVGVVQGFQTKNQIPVEEEPWYVPGTTRQLFTVDDVPFGITICHEGWRFPESVRWPAAMGAKIVFHPHMTGSDVVGPTLSRWGDPDGPYYEKAMLCRGIESTVYFASVNYALRYQESATSLIDPDGFLIAHQPYGEPGLLVHDIDLDRATGFIARRFDPATYPASPESD